MHFSTACRNGRFTVYSTLILVLAFALALVAAFVFPKAAYADGELIGLATYKKSGDSYQFVEYKTYGSAKEALSAAEDWVDEGDRTVEFNLLRDWDLAQLIKVPEGKTYTFNLHGHVINRNNISDYSGEEWNSGSGNGELFYLNENSTLIVNGGSESDEASIEHKGTLVKQRNNSAIWKADANSSDSSATIKGGLLTGGCCDDKGGAGAISCYDKYAKVYLNDVTVAGNVSGTWNKSYGYGGAVTFYDDGCKMELSNASLKWNAAAGDGGAVYVDGENCSVTLKNGSSIDGNYALGHGYADGYGGGIYADKRGCKVYLDGGSSISNNYATSDGGGVCFRKTSAWRHDTDDTVIELKGASKVENNYSAGNGGGIYEMDSDNSTRAVRNYTVSDGSSVSNNQCAGKGGGIYFYIVKSKFQPSVESPTVILTVENNSHIDGNTAQHGGAIYSIGDTAQQIRMTNESTMDGNTAKGASASDAGTGGAIYCYGKLSMSVDTGSSVSSNKAGMGGAIATHDSLGLALSTYSAMKNNHATVGGALFVQNSAAVVLNEYASIEANTADAYGSAIRTCADSKAKVSIESEDGTGTIQANVVKATYDEAPGGTLYLESETTISNVSITGNVVSGGYGAGGAIIAYNTVVKLTDCTITDNAVSGSAGGGIEVWSDKKDANAFNGGPELVLGGTLEVSGNTANGNPSDIHLWQTPDASTSDLENDNNLLVNRIGESTDTPLTESSHIGLQRWVADGLTHHNVTRSSGGVTAPASVFFSDDPAWSVEKSETGVVSLKNEANYNLIIYGNSEEPVVRSIAYGNGNAKASIYEQGIEKSGAKVDYFTVEGLEGVDKLEPQSNGIVVFTMPTNDVVLRAHYVYDTSNLAITVADPATSWDGVGTASAYASSVSYTGIDGQTNAFTCTKDDSSSQASLNSVNCTNIEATDTTPAKKKVTYAVLVKPGSFMNEWDSSLAATVSVKAGFDYQVCSNAKVEPQADGTVLVTGEVEFAQPSKTSKKVTVECQTSASPYTLGTVVYQVEALGPVTLEAPSFAGYTAVGWNYASAQGSATVEVLSDNSIKLSNITSDISLVANYSTVAKSVEYTMDSLVPGSKFPTTLKAFAANDVNGKTEYPASAVASDTISVTWTKADGTLVTGDALVEGNTQYIATIVTKFGYEYFGYGTGCVIANGTPATINSYATSVSVKDGQQTVAYRVTTDDDDSFDSLITTFSPISITKADDANSNKLVSTAIYKLKNGKVLSANITWGELNPDPAMKDGTITVKGTFEDNKGVQHEVEQQFVLVQLSAPVADPSGGTIYEKQDVSLYLDFTWNGISDPDIYYCIVKQGEELPSLDKFTKTTRGADQAKIVTLGENWEDGGTYTLAVYAKTGQRVTDVATYTYHYGKPHGIGVACGVATDVDGNVIKEAYTGDRVYLKAEVPSNELEFQRWNVIHGDGVVIEDENSTTTSFVMPSVDYVQVEAIMHLKQRWSVTVNYNNGEPSDTQRILNGELAIEPKDPTKDFCTFEGWYSDEACTKEFDFKQPITADTNIYAKWSNPIVRINFDSDGGRGVNPYIVESGQPIGSLPITQKEGCTFKGWFTEDGQKVDAGWSFTDAETTLKAGWDVNTYSVVFYSEGEPYCFDSVAYGNKAEKPNDPTREGYTFKGWYTDEACTQAYSFETPVTSNKQLYAKWEQDQPQTYTVEFETGEGSKPETQTVQAGQKATQPANPTRSGYVFEGWYSDEAYTTEFDFTQPITQNVILHAKWGKAAEETVTVTFECNGGSKVGAKTLTKGTPLGSAPETKRENCVFKGWYADEDCTIEFNFNQPITKDTTLFAKWNQMVKVSFDSDGGRGVSPYIVEQGETIGGLPISSKQGYTFKGWFTEDGKKVNASWTTDTAATLKAGWAANSYAVVYYSDGSYYNFDSVEYGKTITAPAKPTKKGYTFEGWYTSEDFANKYDFESPVTGEMALYAKWSINSYKVVFNTNSGTSVKPQTVQYGGCAEEPTNPTRQGYVFKGWYADEACTVMFDFAKPIEGETQVYAKWAKLVTVSFDSDGGSAVDPVQVEEGTALDSLPSTTREGYTFNGWFNGTAAVTAETTFSEDATLKASWTKKAEPAPDPAPKPEDGGDSGSGDDDGDDKGGNDNGSNGSSVVDDANANNANGAASGKTAMAATGDSAPLAAALLAALSALVAIAAAAAARQRTR